MPEKHADCLLCGARTPLCHPPVAEQYRTLGVQKKNEAPFSLYTFRVWAPRADAVYLVGDFVGWEKGRPMTALSQGIWEYHLTTELPLEGQKYKYRIVSRTKSAYFADPYAKSGEFAPDAASIVHTTEHFPFQDKVWIDKRSKNNPLKESPFSIYAVDLATFRTHNSRPSDEPFAVLGYRALADLLTCHVKSLGYTHIAILPDEKAPGGRFFPSPRFGSPEDFAYFVNKLHTNGVGVLYPFLPLDDTLYFHENECTYTCQPIASRLIDSLLYFAKAYHIDGFVSIGFESEEETAFLPLAAKALKAAHPELLWLHQGEISHKEGIDLVTNDSVTSSLFRYFTCDPYFRRYHHGATTPTFSSNSQTLLYEAPLLSTTYMASFFGSYEEKFATLRLYRALNTFLPGVQMHFMGGELAPFRAYNARYELEWFLLDFPMHKCFFDFCRALGAFRCENSALWAKANDSFCVVYENADHNVTVYRRQADDGKMLYGVFNFSAAFLSGYSIPTQEKALCEVFSTDRLAFGGSGHENTHLPSAKDGSITLDIPPLSAVILQPVT